MRLRKRAKARMHHAAAPVDHSAHAPRGRTSQPVDLEPEVLDEATYPGVTQQLTPARHAGVVREGICINGGAGAGGMWLTDVHNNHMGTDVTGMPAHHMLTTAAVKAVKKQVQAPQGAPPGGDILTADEMFEAKGAGAAINHLALSTYDNWGLREGGDPHTMQGASWAPTHIEGGTAGSFKSFLGRDFSSNAAALRGQHNAREYGEP